MHQTARDHLTDVLEILAMSSFDFRQRLRVEIEVMECDPTHVAHQGTPFLPSGGNGYEIRR